MFKSLLSDNIRILSQKMMDEWSCGGCRGLISAGHFMRFASSAAHGIDFENVRARCCNFVRLVRPAIIMMSQDTLYGEKQVQFSGGFSQS